MRDTGTTLAPELQTRLARPYFQSRRFGPVLAAVSAANWTTEAFAPAGMLRSTANDMLKYLSANLGNPCPTTSGTGTAAEDLCAAMGTAHLVRHPIGPNADIAMGWHVLHREGYEEPIFWHNGQTGGYRSFAAFLREAKVAVVVLSNTTENVDGIAMKILAAAGKS